MAPMNILTMNGTTSRTRKDGKPDRRYKCQRPLKEIRILKGRRPYRPDPLKEKLFLDKERKESNHGLVYFLLWVFFLAWVITLLLQGIETIREGERINKLPKATISPVIEHQWAEPLDDTPIGGVWFGKSSWYGELDSECLGCRTDRLMTNGKRFNDSARTVAFNRLPMGSMIRVTNTENGESMEAEVTDTGGFEGVSVNGKSDPRIIDLSKSLSILLECNNCQVKVEEL